jgi:hypothetical protein
MPMGSLEAIFSLASLLLNMVDQASRDGVALSPPLVDGVPTAGWFVAIGVDNNLSDVRLIEVTGVRPRNRGRLHRLSGEDSSPRIIHAASYGVRDGVTVPRTLPTRNSGGEMLVIPGKRLGRLPHDPERPALSLSKLLTGAVPAHPVAADHFSRVSSWGTLANDQYSCCGPAMAMHNRMLISRYLTSNPFAPTVSDTLDLYRRCGNPRFPYDDNGVVLADMFAEMALNGVGPADARVRPVAYARVNVADLDEVHAAIAIFGDVSTGVNLQRAQSDQTDARQPWELSSGSQEWGGHAVLTGYYTSDTTAGRPDPSCVSWGKVQGITGAFWRARAREAWVVIWPEHFGASAFIQGIDQSTLANDYRALTGSSLPTVSPPPRPGPPLAVIATLEQLTANDSLAALAQQYIHKTHISTDNRDMAKELDMWLRAWRKPL